MRSGSGGSMLSTTSSPMKPTMTQIIDEFDDSLDMSSCLPNGKQQSAIMVIPMTTTTASNSFIDCDEGKAPSRL